MKNGNRHWVKFIIQIYQRFWDDDISALSAQLTYYLILSVFPFLLFFINVLSYTSISYMDIANYISVFIPYDINLIIENLIAETVLARSMSLLMLGALFTILSASQGINAIRRGLNKAYNCVEDRPFWKVGGLAAIFTIGIVLVIVITIIFLVTGKVLGNYVFGLIDASYAFELIWTLLRYLFPLIVMISVFSLFYKFIPNRRIKLKEIIPGSVFSALGWIGTSWLFSFYINSFGSFTRVYGSLGGIIVLLIWLYFSSTIILLGGEINAALSYFRSNAPIAKYENYSIGFLILKKLIDFWKKKK